MGVCGCRQRREQQSEAAEARPSIPCGDEGTSWQPGPIPSVQPYRPSISSYDEDTLLALVHDNGEEEAIRHHCAEELDLRERRRQRDR